MGMKRYLCLLFACIAIFSCIPAQAVAADIGEQAAEIAEPRATGEFDFEISAKSMRKASTSFPIPLRHPILRRQRVSTSD